MSLKDWTPRYSIHFYDYMALEIDNHRYDIKSVKLVDDVAKTLQVPVEDIIIAFYHWGAQGYQQEHFYVTGQGTKTRGGTYDIGILIWNYQGGHKESRAPPNTMGVIKKAREWGKGYDTIGVQESFYLGPLA